MNGNRVKCLGALGAALAVLIIASSSAGGGLSIDGYLKNYSSVYEFPDFRLGPLSVNPPPVGAVSNRLRLKARWPISPRIIADVAYDLEGRIQDHALFGSSVTAYTVGQSYRIDDFDDRLYPSENDPVGSFGLFENLDRAQLEIRLGRVDLYVGRQAIAWGSAHVINPTDILTPFSYDALDTEDRPGVDAVRTRVPTGFMGELDAGLVAGKDGKTKNSAAFLRYKTYLARTDVTTMVIGFREHLMAGLDMTRAVGGAGTWLEVAHVWPKLLQPDADIRPGGYWRASTGADYNLGANTYGFIEYHYNQPGASNPDDYLPLLSTPAYQDGAVYLLGKHYLAPGLSHQFTPLVAGNGEVLWNLSDGSAYFTASVEYNLAEDVYLACGGYLGVGPGPSSVTQIGSEFGAYPDTFYSSFRYYF